MRSMLIQTTSNMLILWMRTTEKGQKALLNPLKKRSSQLLLDRVTNSSRNWIEFTACNLDTKLTVWTLNSSACLFVQLHQGITLLYWFMWKGKAKQTATKQSREGKRLQIDRIREMKLTYLGDNWTEIGVSVLDLPGWSIRQAASYRSFFFFDRISEIVQWPDG